MGKKKRSHPDVEELLARPWCYYCERDFEDLKLLISHQKAKHFKCERCGRRLNTAGGLSVHMNQVHKESLAEVENALPNRQGLDVEIFGMEGVPDDIVQQHNQRIIQNYYQAQAERRAATGNPPPGQSGSQGPAKKIKIETADELKKRLAEHRAKMAARKAAGETGSPAPPNGQSPAQNVGCPCDVPSSVDQSLTLSPLQNGPFPPPQAGFEYQQQQQYGQPPAGQYPPQQFPGSYPPGAAPYGAPGALPARPGSNPPAQSGLPQRPPYGANYPAGAYPPPGGSASTLDELVSGAARQGDDIDQMIRMAEAGIKAPKPEGVSEAPAAEKVKKEKAIRMIYADTEVSLEERLGQMSRYASAAA